MLPSGALQTYLMSAANRVDTTLLLKNLVCNYAEQKSKQQKKEKVIALNQRNLRFFVSGSCLLRSTKRKVASYYLSASKAYLQQIQFGKPKLKKAAALSRKRDSVRVRTIAS